MLISTHYKNPVQGLKKKKKRKFWFIRPISESRRCREYIDYIEFWIYLFFIFLLNYHAKLNVK